MAMKLRNILIFFCCIVHGINTQNRIPGDAISMQKRMPGNRDDKAKESTSTKINADVKNSDKKRTLVKDNDNPKKGGKDGISTKKYANRPKINAPVKRENSPSKDQTGFDPVRRKSRKVKGRQDRRKGGMHTKSQDQYATAPLTYPLYEDNSPMDDFGSYPVYDQNNFKPLAGQKPSMLGYQDTFQNQVTGHQGRVPPFGGNFPTLPNSYDDTSLRGSLNGLGDLKDGHGRLSPLEGSRSPQLGIPERFNSPYSGRNGRLAPTEDGTYPQLVNPARSNFPLSGRNHGLGPLEGGTYPQLGKPDNSPLSRRNVKFSPLGDESYPSVEGNAGLKSPTAYRRSYPQIGSQYDNYGRGVEDGDFHKVVGQDDIDYLSSNGERYYSTNGFNAEVLGGGNYPLLGSQDGQFGHQRLPGRQSGREGMPDELVKRNRLWK